MSVLKNHRSLSKMEFYVNAIKIRKNITYILLKDFGVKDKVRSIDYVTKNMKPEDAQQFRKILKEYDMENLLDVYPEWFIAKCRDNLTELSRDLVWYITEANSIYPTNISEYEARRNMQNRAVSSCEKLLQEMQYDIDILPVDMNKYLKYAEMIDREISLLKGWRKSDNRILRRLKKEKEGRNDQG